MRNTLSCLVILSLIMIIHSCQGEDDQTIVSGELKKWHKLTLTFTGPVVHEQDTPNPFLDFRLNVLFKHENREYLVPGFYSADGNAAHSGASRGNKWQVRFVPDLEGTWEYHVSFRKGENIAINDDKEAGEPAAFDGDKGSFVIGPNDKKGRDLR
ncbi:MAG: DUF5060 domain-containing protein, partial [Bacteroidales bacterium]